MVLNQHGAVFVYDGVKYIVGEPIICTEKNEYKGLTGHINEIRDGEDKETENPGPELYCSLMPPAHPCDIEELEATFSKLYGQPKTISDIALDRVVMDPSMVMPTREIEEHQVRLLCYIVSEEWVVDSDFGYNTWYFTDYVESRRIFAEKLAYEMACGSAPDWRQTEAYRTECGPDFFECWLDGEHDDNYYKISIREDEIVIGSQTVTDMGLIHQRRSRREDFVSQVTGWDELEALTEEEYLQFISDERISDRIEDKLGKNGPYWECYWESVSEVAGKLLREYLKKAQEEGGQEDEPDAGI